MSLAAGTRVGSYEVIEPLGAGGMGEVYRARDSRLNRQVAIKTLPSVFASDTNRMARFQREAHLLAALSHPNIAAVYGLEESDGVRALVMELVEGPTLAQRIAAGPIPPEEALEIARQIGAALEAAHEKGIMHRDLKPANIKIAPDGTVKVLDFGLAKALDAEPASGGEPANSPTLTLEATRAGVILGTAGYMSPEQARGKMTDKRTDIWAFGVVLYEMLTGRTMFEGETVSDTMAGVLRGEIDWKLLPPDTPPAVRRLLERCLQRDPKRRLRDIGDAWLEIDAAPEKLPAEPKRPARWWPWLALAGVAAGIAGIGMDLFQVPAPAPQPVVRWQYSPGTIVVSLALSRDGTRLAYTEFSNSGLPALAVRKMDEAEAKPLPGTVGGFAPVFSPDGQWIAYISMPGAGAHDLKIVKIPLAGGTAITICNVTAPDPYFGMVWADDGNIIFGGQRLMRVPASGGTPEALPAPDPANAGRKFLDPVLLPGGQVLFTRSGGENAQVGVLDWKKRTMRVLVANGASARYVPTGQLVYWRSGTLFAAPFDARRLAITGPEIPVVEGVSSLPADSGADWAVSASGLLAYLYGTGGGVVRTVMQWTDRQGVSQPIGDPAQWGAGRLSPDGLRIANSITTAKGQDIWIYELARRILTRITFEGNNGTPTWTPDGQTITFSSDRQGKSGLYNVAADASGKPELLLETQTTAAPHCWTPDGKTLVYSMPGGGRRHLWRFSPGGKPILLHDTPFRETDGQVSPDGRWLAYQSDESGSSEIYVQPFPGPGGKTRISTNGGTAPRWARNGRELFYWNTQLMSVAVEPGAALRPGMPRPLFQMLAGTTWDPAPDGKRFLTEVPASASEHRAIVGLTNWFEELRGR
jgi:Tol biopolymer transport system component